MREIYEVRRTLVAEGAKFCIYFGGERGSVGAESFAVCGVVFIFLRL